MKDETTPAAAGVDEEAESFALPRASVRPLGDRRPRLSLRYAAAASFLVASVAAASLALLRGGPRRPSSPPGPPADATTTATSPVLQDVVPSDPEPLAVEWTSVGGGIDPASAPDIPSHFFEETSADVDESFANPLPSGAADLTKWSQLPVSNAAEHTLGYPFVAACVDVTEETRPIARRMAGEFDILDAFPNDDGGDTGLFGAGESKKDTETWTYSFLLHNEEDLSYFLTFDLPYVPDLVETRDLQDARVGISHEDEEHEASPFDNPGRQRRLAKPRCNDGTCRKECRQCASDSQECTTCLGGGGGGGGGDDVYAGTGECAILTPVDYNARFTPGLLGSYGAISSYNCYRTVTGTNNTADDIVANYPTLAEKRVLTGFPTEENGLSLYVLVLTNKAFDPATAHPAYGEKGVVLSTSSIHSREFAPAETMTRFAEYLLQNYDSDPDVRWILDWNEIHLVLHANPDGRKYDEVAKDYWRKNRRIVSPCSSSSNYGIDLNRNFPFKHNGCEESGCSSGTCSSETYRGPSPGSEQETKAIVEYAKTIFPEGQRWDPGTIEAAEAQADLNTALPEDVTGVFMDVHSYGKYVGYAWGYKNLRSGNDDGIGALGRKMASYNRYRLWAPEMPANQYPVDGDTLDTMYGFLGTAGLFWELGTSFYQSCSSLPGILNEAFPGLLYAAKVAKSPFVTSKGPDVLCLTLGAQGAVEGGSITVSVDVSDSERATHADDGGTLFTTGGQNIASVELYIDNHPNTGSTADAVATLAGDKKTVTGVALTFSAPAGEGEHVVYVRAVDAAGYAGPVTARSFATCPVGGCPFSASPTRGPTTTPPPVPAPAVCDGTCTACGSRRACRGQGCRWSGGLCIPR